jgi:DNA-binding PucR family transcriptional regulator
MELEKIRKLYENVDKNELTARERQLYHLIFTDSSVSKQNLADGKYRILQFSNADFSELESTLKLLLPDFAAADAAKKIVYERFSNDNPTKSELFDIFQTLSQDMGEEISAYVGMFVEKNQLQETYTAEAKIFRTQKSFSEYMLNRSLKVFDNKMLITIQKNLQENKEDQELVKALYSTQGNQSQAAKNLYVHRNTLLNKIKKYEQKYGLQLVGSDLVLAFNLL